MKKLIGTGSIWLSILFGVFPYIEIQAVCVGFAFELHYPLATYTVLVFLEFVVFVGVRYGKLELGEPAKIFTAVFLLISVVGAGYYGAILAKWDYSFVVFVLLAVASVTGAAVMMFYEVKEKGVKIAFSIVTLVAGAVVWLFLFMCLFFGNIGVTKVMHGKESPDGRYVAEVIDDDQGALGGSTIVKAGDYGMKSNLDGWMKTRF